MKHDYRPLTNEELAELTAFAKSEGRKWKHTLMYEYWMRGLPVRGFPLIYGLRNTHGPTWLDSFKLPKV